MSRPSSQSGQATSSQKLLSTPLPSPAPPSQWLRTKGQGPGEGSHVFISLSPWCWESRTWFVVRGVLGQAPCCKTLQLLLVTLIRMTSSPEVCFQHVPSALPLVTLHGPSRSRTLVTSQSPQPPGPFVGLRWRICPLMTLPPMTPTPRVVAEQAA